MLSGSEDRNPIMYHCFLPHLDSVSRFQVQSSRSTLLAFIGIGILYLKNWLDIEQNRVRIENIL